LKVVLAKKEEDLQKIVAVRKIRDMFRDQSAERHLKQVQAKRERLDTDRKEREAVALSYGQSVRELAVKKREAATESAFGRRPPFVSSKNYSPEEGSWISNRLERNSGSTSITYVRR
jgi:hypothetical protein